MSNAREFELTEEHIALLYNLEWAMQDWEEPGAPGADARRPYGSSGHNAVRDIAEMMDRTQIDPDDDEYADWEADILEVWNGTADALQIIMETQSFEPGTYIKRNGRQWKRKE